MQAFDEESHRRIREHRHMRAGKGFETIERYTELDELLIPKDCVVLLECMSNLVANEMFRKAALPGGGRKDYRRSENLLSQAKHVVIVTNEIFSDGILYEEESEQYKKRTGTDQPEAGRGGRRGCGSRYAGSLCGIKGGKGSMKSLWNSFKASFAMFSKIPMPMVDWKKENIKYMMLLFPFVGTAIGILTWLAGGILRCMQLWNHFSRCDPYCDPGIYYRRHSCRRASGHIGCIKLLAGTHKEAGDPEGFPMQVHLPLSQPVYILSSGWEPGISSLKL